MAIAVPLVIEKGATGAYGGIAAAGSDVEGAVGSAGGAVEGEDVGGDGGGEEVGPQPGLDRGAEIQHQVPVRRREVGELRHGRRRAGHRCPDPVRPPLAAGDRSRRARTRRRRTARREQAEGRREERGGGQ